MKLTYFRQMKNLVWLKYYIIVLVSSFLSSACFYSPVMNKNSLHEHSALPVNISSDFIWGINGHPIEDKAYLPISIEKQLDLLSEHQMTFYRIDVNTLQDGGINTKDNRNVRFENLLKESEKRGVSILPVIKFYNIHLENQVFTSDEAYNKGKNQGQGFASRYGEYFDYYGLGNELDLKAQLPNTKGMKKEDYDNHKMELITAYLKGLSDGIKSIEPTAKTIINCALWVHWGYLDILKEKNVDYDILGYHWYSDNGRPLLDINIPNINALKVLESYNKPIWLTEINRKRGSLYYREREQDEMMKMFLRNISDKNSIKAFFVYELFDQSHLLYEEWAGAEETSYGIIGWKSDPPNYSEFHYKPASATLKFGIEEAKHGYEDFIYAVMTDMYGNIPSESDLRYWTSRFQTLKNKELIINEILENSASLLFKKMIDSDHAEGFSTYITAVYQTFLNRIPDNKELKFWNRRLKKRIKQEDLPIKIMLSEEYWENAIWSGYERRTGFSRPNALNH